MENHTEHKEIKKRLYRSEKDVALAGICGGLGEYFNTDPVVIRLFWLIVTIFSGVFPGLIAYGFAILLVPKRPHA